LLPTLPLCEIMLLVLYMCIRCSGGLSAREYNGGLSDENVPIYIYIYIYIHVEDEFNRTLNESEHIEPFNRPLLPKQQSSKKCFAIIEILNQFILPKFVNNTTSFKKLHSIIVEFF
jgi:hypothetical protein